MMDNKDGRYETKAMAKLLISLKVNFLHYLLLHSTFPKGLCITFVKLTITKLTCKYFPIFEHSLNAIYMNIFSCILKVVLPKTQNIHTIRTANKTSAYTSCKNACVDITSSLTYFLATLVDFYFLYGRLVFVSYPYQASHAEVVL